MKWKEVWQCYELPYFLPKLPYSTSICRVTSRCATRGISRLKFVFTLFPTNFPISPKYLTNEFFLGIVCSGNIAGFLPGGRAGGTSCTSCFLFFSPPT